MKRILSFLLCVAFLKAQVLAMTGGPNENSDSQNVDVSGTYSGVLIPQTEDSGTPTLDGTETLNSLGLFTIGMPTSGPGSGTFLIFTQGLTFSGTITAVGDPGKASVNAILEGTYDYTDFVYDATGAALFDTTTGQLVTQDYSVPVRGTLYATVASTGFTDISALQASNYGRIKGKAEMGIIFSGVADRVLRYDVDGVKQDFATTGGGGTGGLTAAGTP